MVSNGQTDSGQRGLVMISDGQADSGQRGLVVMGNELSPEASWLEQYALHHTVSRAAVCKPMKALSTGRIATCKPTKALAVGRAGPCSWSGLALHSSEQQYPMAELLCASVSSVSRPGKPYLLLHTQAYNLQGSKRIAQRQSCDVKSSSVKGRNKGKQADLHSLGVQT